MSLRLLSALLLSLPFFSIAQSGTIDPVLQLELDAVSHEDPVTSILVLNERIPLNWLSARLDIRNADRAERHREVGLTARAIAERTQASLLRSLESWDGPGEVTSIRPFWIINAVAVEGTPEAISALAARPEVALALPNESVEIVRPVTSAPAVDKSPGGIEYGLAQVKAPQMWAMGITGEGSVVCNLDTGVRGTHPAVSDRWLGNDVPAHHAWHDAVAENPEPYDNDRLSPTHGSHTMGTMCGLEAATSDTIGVAFGAKWIAAKVFNRFGSGTTENILEAFEWVADPDGNPFTSNDVPDVVNNSWGFTGGACDPAVWDAMDLCEAMGAAVVFAAGNEGNAGLRSPGDRISSSTNAFAVGATEEDESIASFSSRGPSKCDNQTKKPEISAPGVDTRSIRRTSYGTMSGTSMACPHASGAIALLRQVDPTASVEELKGALYLSARDKGTPGEDNVYGRGIIDLPAAARLLGEPAPVEIEAEGPGSITPGETLTIDYRLENVSGEETTFDLWFSATAPNDQEFANPNQVSEITLGAREFLEGSVNVRVPMVAPAGTFVVMGKAGSYPFAKASNGFEITIR